VKKCSKCKNMKPLEEFHKSKCRKDGLAPACKCCKKIYNNKRYSGRKRIVRMGKEERLARERVRDSKRRDRVRVEKIQKNAEMRLVEVPPSPKKSRIQKMGNAHHFWSQPPLGSERCKEIHKEILDTIDRVLGK